MARFTDSPYEYMMTQKPYMGRHRETGPPLSRPDTSATAVHMDGINPALVCACAICRKKEETGMSKHKKAALLLAAILAALIGIGLAVSPSIDRHPDGQSASDASGTH